MPARLRSTYFYQKPLQADSPLAQHEQFRAQVTAGERHERVGTGKMVVMVHNTVERKNGLPWNYDTNRIRGGQYFSCPDAKVSTSEKTQLIVGKADAIKLARKVVL